MALEKREIELLNHDVLIAELEAYEAETLPSGLIRYGAPAGLHDDCVMSLLLAFGPNAHGTNQSYADGAGGAVTLPISRYPTHTKCYHHFS
ncbi:MAG: hypothetical protein R2867_19820 [Caldilineaceae bacterium]